MYKVTPILKEHRPVQRTHRYTCGDEEMRRCRTEWKTVRGQCSGCQRTEWSAWAGTILDRSWRKWNWLWALKNIYRREIRYNLSEDGEAIYHFHAVHRQGEGQKSNLDCHKAVGNMRMLWSQTNGLDASKSLYLSIRYTLHMVGFEHSFELDYCFTMYWVILKFL